MIPAEALKFAADFRPNLPDGWGYLVWLDDDGVKSLIVTETEPPMPDGWMIWISRTLLGGRILNGAVMFGSDDRPQDVEARAWVVLGLLRAHERLDAARWN